MCKWVSRKREKERSKIVFVPVLVVVALCSLRNFLMFFWCSSFSTWKNLEIRTAAFLPFLFIIFSAYVLENVSLYTLCKTKYSEYSIWHYKISKTAFHLTMYIICREKLCYVIPFFSTQLSYDNNNDILYSDVS